MRKIVRQGVIASAGRPSAFKFTVNTANTSAGSSAADQITLPLIASGSYAAHVLWGDGTYSFITAYNQAEVTHTYASSGTYTITITGGIKGWKFANGGDKLKMLDVKSWGPLKINDQSAFYGCSNLTSSATDVFVFENVMANDVRQTFRDCPLFDQNLSALDMTGLVVGNGFFRGCSSFNNGGDPGINNWVMGSFTSIAQFFMGNSSFNQPVGGWNVSNNTNGDLLFFQCTIFNQNISAWNVAKFITMNSMFGQAAAFNNGGDSGINNWNTIALQQIDSMMNGAAGFTHTLANWIADLITSANQAFRSMGSVNINLSGWNMASCTNWTSFMFATTMTTANYDAALIAWDGLDMADSQNPNFGGSQYTLGGAAEAARNGLIANDLWTITDGGGI